MGGNTSKAAQTAGKLSASNTARRYPTRSPPLPASRTTQPPPNTSAKPESTVPPAADISQTNDQSTDFDSPSSASLQARLRTLGPVQPNPTHSNTSTYDFARSPTLSHSDGITRSQLSQINQTSQTLQPSNTSQTHPSTSHDPSLSHSQFRPSPSNPLQSIFPQSQNPSSTQRENPAVSLLTARYRIAAEADAEFADIGRKGSQGRSFLDVQTLRQVVVLRGEGMSNERIEAQMGLRKGVVGRLGREGIVGVAN